MLIHSVRRAQSWRLPITAENCRMRLLFVSLCQKSGLSDRIQLLCTNLVYARLRHAKLTLSIKLRADLKICSFSPHWAVTESKGEVQ